MKKKQKKKRYKSLGRNEQHLNATLKLFFSKSFSVIKLQEVFRQRRYLLRHWQFSDNFVAEMEISAAQIDQKNPLSKLMQQSV